MSYRVLVDVHNVAHMVNPNVSASLCGLDPTLWKVAHVTTCIRCIGHYAHLRAFVEGMASATGIPPSFLYGGAPWP